MAAIARLDARICASLVAPAWRLRAAWTGYTRALQLQRVEIDEIDVFAGQCGLHLPGRGRIATTGDPFGALPAWQARLAEPAGSHWREDLPFSFELPRGWAEAPALVRALDLADIWCRNDASSSPWLARPILLARLKLTHTPLPCLAGGDEAQRFALDARPALLKRLLKGLRKSAEDGLERLDALERFRLRAATAVASEHRPGKLTELTRLALARPSLAARTITGELGVTPSGAGKLLARAEGLGLLVAVGARQSWRTYVTPDVAVALGVKPPERGRPRGQPQPTRAVDAILGQFDAEMAAIDSRLQRLGIAAESQNSYQITEL
ncbi:hypothetical protein [Novosphingobium sp.]|jgi:hypothetical protein|uniref:hypothetical protein n=1 Tax=Novosphingobium sp. TaxID=1874826 RepID=UPI002733EAD8|nr:hypothetical protein [Novosphingobium sp.]MDP3907054.1 hypothetical protein [Novosphingobium sp.]